MVVDISLAVLGGVFGFLSGWFFDKRARNAAREDNSKLRRELRAIAAGYGSVGPSGRAVPAGVAPDLPTAVRARAIATQDASGKVGRHDLIAYFVQRGPTAADVEVALRDLVAAGILLEEGKWVRVP